MSFELFCTKVHEYSKASGLSILKLIHEDGLHVARFSDGSQITANSKTASVTWRDPYRNHCQMYTPQAVRV